MFTLKFSEPAAYQTVNHDDGSCPMMRQEIGESVAIVSEYVLATLARVAMDRCGLCEKTSALAFIMSRGEETETVNLGANAHRASARLRSATCCDSEAVIDVGACGEIWHAHQD